MFRYIIVDDEVLIRRGLISKISDITSIETACVGEAANGVEGLALIESADPDIIITDMKMAKMDGTEFLEKISEKYPDKAIIVISGYKAFHYVSKAIEKKAVGYVLKPFSTEEIEKQLKKAAEQIQQQKNLIRLEEKVAFFEQKKEQDIILEAILEPWNEAAGEELNSRNYERNHFHMLLSVYTETEEFIYMSEEICKGHLNDIEYMVMENPLNKYQYFILLTVSEENRKEKMEIKAGHIAQYLIKAVPENKLYVFISEIVQDYERINKCYLTCEKLLRQLILTNRSSLLSVKDLLEQKEMVYTEDYMKDLFRKLKYQNQDIRNLMEDFFHGMNSSVYSFGEIGNTCENLIRKVNEYAVQNNTETDDIMRVFYRRYLFESSLLKMKKEISGYVILILNSVRMAAQGNDLIFVRITEYIQNNYHKKLTLQMLASQFYISESGCSSLIKEKLGISYNEYLGNIRLEKAKQLLTETNLSAESISDEIGYSNPKYFFKIFKKMTNQTPTEYRSKYRRK